MKNTTAAASATAPDHSSRRSRKSRQARAPGSTPATRSAAGRSEIAPRAAQANKVCRSLISSPRKRCAYFNPGALAIASLELFLRERHHSRGAVYDGVAERRPLREHVVGVEARGLDLGLVEGLVA